MTEQENTQRARRLYAAFAQGDMATYRQTLSDDVVLHIPGHSPVAGRYEGVEGVFGFLGTAVRLTGNTFRFEVDDILASQTRAAALGRVTAERGSMRLDTRMVEVRRFDADGLVSAIEVYLEDSAAFDAIFS